jgi:phi LC3 family holin
MKSINWKVRFKKKSFWVAIVSAIALFINNITQAARIRLHSSQLNKVSNGINGVHPSCISYVWSN